MNLYGSLAPIDKSVQKEGDKVRPDSKWVPRDTQHRNRDSSVYTVVLRGEGQKKEVLWSLNKEAQHVPKESTGFVKEMGWGIPGGGVEAGESLTDAAIRETEEETRLRPELDLDFQPDQDIAPNGHTNWTFLAKSFTGSPSPGSEIIKLEWVPVELIFEWISLFEKFRDTQEIGTLAQGRNWSLVSKPNRQGKELALFYEGFRAYKGRFKRLGRVLRRIFEQQQENIKTV